MSRFGYTSLGFGSGVSAAGGGFTNAFSVEGDGVATYVDIGTVSELGTMDEFSISVWAYLHHRDTDNDKQTLFASGNSGVNRLYFTADMSGSGEGARVLQFWVGSTWVYTPGGALNTDAWNHCVYTQTGTTGKLYVDGALEATKTNQTALSNSALQNNVRWGNYWTTYKPINGNLDEGAFWTSELSAAQVTNIYKGESDGGSGGTNGTPGSLETFDPLGWWRMGDSAGDTIDGGGSPADDGVVGTVVNAADPGTYDGSGEGGIIYKTSVPAP